MPSAMIEILFLSANPLDAKTLQLDEEVRAIDLAIRLSELRDLFSINASWAVRLTDLFELLLRRKPAIVHFSGHGAKSSGILLENNAGRSELVSAKDLGKIFSVFKENIRCVVLDYGYSQEQALAIAEHIDCVIGIPKAFAELAAITFVSSFYQALGFGKDVKTAFDLASNQLEIEGLSYEEPPKLLALHRNPEDIVFRDIDIVATGERNILIEGAISDSIIVTANHNVLYRNEQAKGDDTPIKKDDKLPVISGERAFERIGAAVRLNLNQLEKNIEQARQESGQFFRLTLVFSSIGFIIVLTGVMLLLAGQVTAGVVTSISSVVPEVTALLFFNKDKELRTTIEAYHQHMLNSQQILTMIDVAETIKNLEEQDQMKQQIIFKVLGIAPTTKSK